jgi:hypothetical protein
VITGAPTTLGLAVPIRISRAAIKSTAMTAHQRHANDRY